MLVADVMTQAVITTTPQAPVKEAAALLATNGFTALPVVDQGDRLVGVVTEQDVVQDRILPDARRRVWHPEEVSPDPPMTVGEVMSSLPLTVTPHTDAAELAHMMIDRRLRSVPVVDDGRLVGIVTRRDLVRTIARNDGLIAADVRRRLEIYGGLDRWTVQTHEGRVLITDEYADPADHHTARILAEAVPGVVHAEVVYGTTTQA
ncbi:MAG: CBS domain-containing protein [Pseudonocardiaceae bacterium]